MRPCKEERLGYSSKNNNGLCELQDLTKSAIFATAKGKMQEWLNWPAWKASKPQKGFGGSNPPLSAKRNEARRCRAIGIFLFYLCTSQTCLCRGRDKTKVVDLSTSCVVQFCREPHGECGERRVAHRAAKSIPNYPSFSASFLFVWFDGFDKIKKKESCICRKLF